MANRNKRCVTLNLNSPRGAELFKQLAATADVIVENFRTGTLERWGLGWETLHAINPRLVMVRVTGFGQTGLYNRRAGFGTVAEVFSGFANITGEPDGPPTLPNFGLADGIAASYGTSAVMFALYHRDVGGGKGQFIDLSLYEPMFRYWGRNRCNMTSWVLRRNAWATVPRTTRPATPIRRVTDAGSPSQQTRPRS